MNQALSGAAFAALLAVCWLLGQRRPRLLSSTDTTAVAALNRGQMERLVEPVAGTAQGEATEPPLPDQLPGPRQPWPLNARSRRQLLRGLQDAYARGGPLRRQAVEACRSWGHRDTLPLLRRALHDSDPAVVAIAASAMAGFRGRTSQPATPQPLARAPRNVSRMR
jgi:hypothetical protein